MRKIGIIGGSSFIESDFVSLLLHSNSDVKIGVNDISKKVNYQHLMELKYAEQLHVCEINTKKHTDIMQFTKDCDVVVFVNPSDIII